MTIKDRYAEIKNRLGRELGPTQWRIVRQEDVTAFGGATYDPDPMHVDPEWARTHSPFGGTIAFGFWTFSMLTSFFHELQGGGDGGDYGRPEGETIGINYGVDRMRLVQPVPVGSRICMRATIADVAWKGPDRFLISTDVVIDIENEQQPALVARWLTMMLVRDRSEALNGFRRATV